MTGSRMQRETVTISHRLPEFESYFAFPQFLELRRSKHPAESEAARRALQSSCGCLSIYSLIPAY
jgi:hypothetical protein